MLAIFTISSLLALLTTTRSMDVVRHMLGEPYSSMKRHEQPDLVELRRQETLEKLTEMMGIRNEGNDVRGSTIVPHFMTELYDAVTDTDGNTLRKNPYDAEIVRGLADTGSFMKNHYLFDVPDLERNESVIAAELHLHRKQNHLSATHPATLLAPCYVLRVYQVLDDENINQPDRHKLVNVHYVENFASGWQILNVKEAVLSWLSGAPNLGLFVTASTIFGKPVAIDFVQMGEKPHDEWPFLILFNNEGKAQKPKSSHRETEMRQRRHVNGQPEEIPDSIDLNWPEYFLRQKKVNVEGGFDLLIPPKRTWPIHHKNSDSHPTLTSMDVYDRAISKKSLGIRVGQKFKSHSRTRRQTNGASSSEARGSYRKEEFEKEPCSRRELYISFSDIGLSQVVAPEVFNAYQCRGYCAAPLSQNQSTWNYAKIMAMYRQKNPAPDQEAGKLCCVPVSLAPLSVIHMDDNSNVVLKKYPNMYVESCGCL